MVHVFISLNRSDTTSLKCLNDCLGVTLEAHPHDYNDGHVSRSLGKGSFLTING